MSGCVLGFNGVPLIHSGSFLGVEYPDYDLPAGTVRIWFSDLRVNMTRDWPSWGANNTWTQVSANPNIWDVTRSTREWAYELGAYQDHQGPFYGDIHYDINPMQGIPGTMKILDSNFNISYGGQNPEPDLHELCFRNRKLTYAKIRRVNTVKNLSGLFDMCRNLAEVVVKDTDSALYIAGMFSECVSLTSIPLFDTSQVTIMGSLCKDCRSLTGQLPLYDTRNVQSCESAFSGCTNISGGALALYNQLKDNNIQSAHYLDCFKNCGVNTTTGLSELYQIPAAWGGRGA